MSLKHVRRSLLKDGAFLAIDKPLGMTSNDVVTQARAIFSAFLGKKTLKLRKQKKLRRFTVGHTGTLDPNASGTLVLAVGCTTPYLRYFTNNRNSTKVYQTTIKLGRSTRTDDASDLRNNSVIREVDLSWLTKEEVVQHLRHFEGDLMQQPPTVSAKHIHGERAHKLEREGRLNPELLQFVPVRIDNLELQEFRPSRLPECDLIMTCGGGTYVRSVARDLGMHIIAQNIGTHLEEKDGEWDYPQYIPGGGSLVSLKRLVNNNFGIEDTLSIADLKIALPPRRTGDEEYLQIKPEVWSKFRSATNALSHLENVVLSQTPENYDIHDAWCLRKWIKISSSIPRNIPPEPPIPEVHIANLERNQTCSVRVTLDDEFFGVGERSECGDFVRKEVSSRNVMERFQIRNRQKNK